MEPQRKEIHLLSGLGVQILIVGLLVFAYTQAIRQVKYQRELFQRLQEQLTMAREQMVRQGPTPDVALMQAQVQKIRPAFLALAEVSPQVERIKVLAEQGFHLQESRWNQSEEPADSFTVSIPGRNDCEVVLYKLEMEARGSSRSAAGLLASVGPDSELPVFPLQTLEIQADPAEPGAALRISCRWLLPVAASLSSQDRLTKPGPRPAREPVWGEREEPFKPQS